MTQTPDNREAIARIEQCDLDLRAAIWSILHDALDANPPRTVYENDHLVAQLIAKHRILATRGDRFAEGVEAAAVVADAQRIAMEALFTKRFNVDGRNLDMIAACHLGFEQLAAAIRSLKAPEAGG